MRKFLPKISHLTVDDRERGLVGCERFFLTGDEVATLGGGGGEDLRLQVILQGQRSQSVVHQSAAGQQLGHAAVGNHRDEGQEQER